LISNQTEEALIQLNVEADNWEAAIRQAAKPLVEKAYITTGYVDAMIESVNEIGPYIVITKHVALPHASEKYGALKTGLGITTLKTGVNFGNENNDPVKYIFCLSANDSSTHLQLMASLVQLLELPEFYTMLDNAQNAKEVLDYLKENERNEDNV